VGNQFLDEEKLIKAARFNVIKTGPFEVWRTSLQNILINLEGWK